MVNAGFHLLYSKIIWLDTGWGYRGEKTTTCNTPFFPTSLAHDRCESVVATLCFGGPDGLVHHPSSEQMCFVQDLALDMAQFLVSAVGQDEWADGALLLNECHIPLQECEKLDQSLALAFRHLTLPPDWSLLGGNNGERTCWSSPCTHSCVATHGNASHGQVCVTVW